MSLPTLIQLHTLDFGPIAAEAVDLDEDRAAGLAVELHDVTGLEVRRGHHSLLAQADVRDEQLVQRALIFHGQGLDLGEDGGEGLGH